MILRSNGHRSEVELNWAFTNPAVLKKAGQLALELLDVMTNK